MRRRRKVNSGRTKRPSFNRWQDLRLKVWTRDNYHCVHCGQFVHFRSAHIDHIVPLSRGGANSMTNLRTLCRPCHCLRYDSTHDKLRREAVDRGIIPEEHEHLLWDDPPTAGEYARKRR